MGYNKDCFEHLRESRKQQRKLVTWKTDSIYVDVETGEIIEPEYCTMSRKPGNGS